MIEKNNFSKVVLDTDFLVALFIGDQSTHKKAKEIFEIIKSKDLFILDLVRYELATVLSRKFSHHLAKDILTKLNNLPLCFTSIKEWEKEIWESLFSYQRKNISFIDCANLEVAKNLNAKIASFDAFYPRDVLISF